MRIFLLILGTLSALLITTQFVLGRLILATGQMVYIKGHQHTGYLTVAVSLVYILLSLVVIARKAR